MHPFKKISFYCKSVIISVSILFLVGSSFAITGNSPPENCSDLFVSVRTLRSIAPESRIAYFAKAKRLDAKGMTSPFTADGQFIPEYAPDTLYSWMSEEFLEKLFANSDGPFLPIMKRPYFSWRTPVGSFGYGKVSIRMRLKDDVQFALVPHFEIQGDLNRQFQALNANYDIENTVFVSEIPSAGYHEYFVLSGGPLHSISYGTPEHLFEVQAEASWIKSHDHYQDFDLIMKQVDLTKPLEWDYGRIWSREILQSNIDRMKKIVSDGQGKILYSPGFKTDPTDHFSSRLKGYWVP